MALLAPLSPALVVSPCVPARALSKAICTPSIRMADDDALPDELPESFNFDDMGLLKLPRMTTPQQAAFDAYRKRRQEESMRGRAPPGGGSFDNGPKKTPLGLDPVEGDPVDLRELYPEDGNPNRPSDAEVQAAEEEFLSMMRGEAPEGFGDDIDRLLGDQ